MNWPSFSWGLLVGFTLGVASIPFLVWCFDDSPELSTHGRYP